MKAQKTTPRRWRSGLAATSACALAVTLAACGSPSTEASTEDDPNATIVVWTDSTRQAGFEMYQKANPDVKMKIETYDPTSLLTKIQLFNRTGKGWPDLVFSGQPNDVATLAGPLFDYAQPLDDLVDEDVQEGFGAANDGCTIDGELFCLKNDLAQTVLWYNKPLMEEFGYEVPTTWDEYQELGLKLVEEHPGYILTAVGSAFSYYNYFWSSGCPLQTVTGDDEVHIDTTDEKCTRVAELLDPLLEAGAISSAGEFDPAVIELGKQGKILMMPSASWFGDFVFQPETAYASAPGTIAAAPYPTWAGEEVNYAGAAGGGIYLVSRHSKNKQGAADVATWMATNDEFQSTSPTYPAYGPAAEAWGKRLESGDFYAENPFEVLKAAAATINPAESPTRYSVEDTFGATVVQSINKGDGVAAALPTLQAQLQSLAQSAGYVLK